MRVLHIIESDGGSTEFIHLLAKYSKSVNHTVLCGERAWKYLHLLKANNPIDFEDNIHLAQWPHAQRELSFLHDFRAYTSLTKWLDANRDFDVVHLHSSKAGFLGRFALRNLHYRTRVIYTAHAVSFLRKDISNFKKRLFILLEKLANSKSSTIVANSKSEQTELALNGIPSIVIPNGTIIEKEDGQIWLGDDTENITVLSIGRLTNQKKPSLFNAIAEHFVHNKNVHFVWVGDGELRAQITSPNTEVTGWLAKKNVLEKLRTAHIYISTALWEGMPLAVLEAMSAGKPLLLSSCVGNIDLIEDNRNGFLFHTEEEAVNLLSKLISDKKLRWDMGDHSRALCVAKYDFRIVTEAYLNAYKKLPS